MDAIGKFLLELRDDDAVRDITDRIRVFEPAPGDAGWETHPTTKLRVYHHAFVVLVMLSTARHPRLPVQEPTIAVRCYGRNQIEAAALYWACSDALHGKGPRVHANGLGIYRSHDQTGGTAEKDPDTGQPYYTFVIGSHATTAVVA